MASHLDDVWSAQDTTPSAIEKALRDLLHERYAESEAYAPARVLNMVVVVDAEWRGEIANRLERVGRYHASRTVLCTVEEGRTTLDARASMAYVADPTPGRLAVCRERVEIDVGPQHLLALDAIVDPVLVSDIATVIWSPHGHQEAIDSLLKVGQVILFDSLDEPELRQTVRRASGFADRAYVVDLAWLRSTPWRERVCASFDPPSMRGALGQISAVTVRQRSDSVVSGLLFLGWLASRLGWEAGSLVESNGSLEGRARARRQDVVMRLDSNPQQDVPGLAGVTVETASGLVTSLDRGPGGLAAERRMPDGHTTAWSILGASRGEGGILGEGIRQGLLRDPTYRPALEAARAMVL